VREGVSDGVSDGVSEGVSEGVSKGVSGGVSEGVSEGVHRASMVRGVVRGVSDGVSEGVSEEETKTMGRLGMSIAAAYMLGPVLGTTLFTSFEESLCGAVVLVAAALVVTLITVHDPGHGNDTTVARVRVRDASLTHSSTGAICTSGIPTSPMSLLQDFTALPHNAKLLLLIRLLLSFGK
jgi:hypothetical protein